MQAVTTQALSSRPSTATLANRSARSGWQPRRPMIATAVKGSGEERTEQKGPNKAIMQTLGAIAAVQLAFGGPAFAQDPLPSSAESQQGRDEVNRETSEAPSLTDIGKNLPKNLFGGGGGADQAKEAAGDAARKAKNAAPDLSGVLDRAQQSIDKISKEAGNAPGPFPEAITNLGRKADKPVARQASAAKDVASSAKGSAEKTASKAKNAAPDLSGLLDDIQAKVSGDVDTTKNKVKSDIDTTQRKVQSDINTTQGKASSFGSDVGAQSSRAGSKAQNAASNAAGRAQNAAPDLSGLLEDFQSKVSGDIDTTQKKVQGDINTTQRKVQGDINTTQGKARSFGSDVGAQSSRAGAKAQNATSNAAGRAKNAAPDLSRTSALPDPQDLLSRLQGKSNSLDAIRKQAAGQTKQFGSDLGSKGNKAGAKAQSTARNVSSKAKNAAPDLSFDPLKFFSGGNESKQASKALSGTQGQNFRTGGGTSNTSKQAREINKGLKTGSKDLPVPEVGKDVDTSGFKKLNKKPSEGTLSK